MDCTQEHSEEAKMENMIMCIGTKGIMEKWLEDFMPNKTRYYYFERNEDGSERFYLFTQNNKYRINFSKTYMGASAESRRQKPGEDWFRGHDLPDGKFHYATFLKIMGIILSKELEVVEMKYLVRRDDGNKFVRDKGYENVVTYQSYTNGGDNIVPRPPGTNSFAYGLKKHQMVKCIEEAAKFLAEDANLKEEHVNNG